MRKSGLIFLFTVFSITILAQKPNLTFSDKIASQKSALFLKKSNFIESQNHSITDFIYQRTEWEIDPNVVFIKGIITTYFKSKSENLSEIEFDFHSSMIADSVIQKGQKLEFTKSENKLIISLPDDLTAGELDSVSIYYQGTPSESGFGTFSKTIHNNIPNIWTLSEPFGAMEWWPCKQSLVDKIDSIDIIVNTPEAYRTASNGVLVSEMVKNGKRKMHWKHRFPIATYLVAISVTNYVNYSDYLELDDGRQIEILNFVYPEDLESAKSSTPVTAEIMALFNEIIGEYPFANEKYGHAQFGWGGGMEHQTMSFMGSFGFGLISHELAHQWFGDYVTLGTWQDIWLNEGFATYMAGLSYEHLMDGVWWPNWKKVHVERIVSEPDGSVFVQDTTDIGELFSGRLSYYKGAYLLHMLRWVLGDDDFFSGIRNYYNDPEIANGFARTNQLISHLESVSDTSLTEFFNDWFYGEGFPVYNATYWTSESNDVTISLSQNPSDSSVGFFEMPVPVRLYNSSKTDSADFRLIHTENNQSYVVNPGFKVAEIKIDPDYWLVSITEEVVNVPLTAISDEVIIYPNPFSDIVNIYHPKNETINDLKLFKLNGKLVKNIKNNLTQLNLSDLASGEYIIKVTTPKRVCSKKIIKL
ncbi:M1 family aminopeptidase [Draconibacterium sp.]|nr:M1 family aminopeptidase [Draconibacterium sp.]